MRRVRSRKDAINTRAERTLFGREGALGVVNARHWRMAQLHAVGQHKARSICCPACPRPSGGLGLAVCPCSQKTISLLNNCLCRLPRPVHHHLDPRGGPGIVWLGQKAQESEESIPHIAHEVHATMPRARRACSAVANRQVWEYPALLSAGIIIMFFFSFFFPTFVPYLPPAAAPERRARSARGAPHCTRLGQGSVMLGFFL